MTVELPDPGDGATSGGGWSPEGGGGDGTFGGSNSDPNDPTQPGDSCRGCGDISTSPIFEEYNEELHDPDSPCNKLNNGTSSLAYKQKFKSLNTQANFEKAHETGFGLVNNTYVDGVPNPSNNSIDLPKESKNGSHVHNNKQEYDPNSNLYYDGAIKMLSPQDIRRTLSMQQYNTDPKDAFTVMISNECIFAIIITEEILLPLDSQTLAVIRNWNIKFQKDAKNILTEYRGSTNKNNRKRELQKLLLNDLKSLGFENKIALFEGDVTESNDLNNYKINWSKKTLDNGTIKTTPCN